MKQCAEADIDTQSPDRMKAQAPLSTCIIISMITGASTTIAQEAMSTQPISQSVANAWSEPIKGLSGRLRIELEDLNPGLRHAIYIELRNHSFVSVAVTNQPWIDAVLLDAAGKPVNTSGFPMSGPIPKAEWVVIPRDAYIGFRVDMQTVGVPGAQQRMALMAVGGKMWGLHAGNYELKLRLVFKSEADAPRNQWIGELTLPPVEVAVMAQALLGK